MRKLKLALAVAGAAVIAGAVAITALPASAQATSFAKMNDWGSGYQGQFTVTNTTSQTISSWRVEFDLPAGSSITQSWNADRVSAGSHHTFTSLSWNGRLAAGASTGFGMIVAGSGSPTNCRVNGVACASTGGGPAPTATPSPAITSSPSASPPPAGDTQAPSVPGGLRSTATTPNSVALAWNPATDNVGVTGYEVYRGTALVATVATTNTTVTGLAAGTAYPFSVRARDAAGNRSAASAAVNATTATAGGGNPGGGNTGGRTPVAINGQLHVCGVNLCNQYDKPIQLRGMSSHGLQWYSQCVNTGSLDALATDWNADVFRIAMYVQEGGYETNPAKFTEQVNNYIDLATARGMYVIVDFHTLNPGDPNHNTERAKTFFAAVAKRNADKNNIIYEIANEPNGVSWAGIKGYAEQVIPVIRAADPDSVVLVGTRAWSSLGVSEGSNETEVVNNPVRATNIMYAFHFYAASHQGNYRETVARAATKLPLFVTEFGTQNASGDGGNDLASSKAWIDLLDRLKIGYAMWTYSDTGASNGAFKPGTCNGSNYAGTGVLKESGVFIRDRIRTPDNFPTR